MVLHLRATRTHFTSKSLTPGSAAIAAGVVLTALAYTVLVWTLEQPAWAQVSGVLVEAAGVWLFLAAIRASRVARLRFAFDPAQPAGLLTDGPYRWIRHPFYASYLLVWAGWALATGSGWSLIPLSVMAGLYLIAAQYEERLFAATPLAREYALYRSRAGLFWPKVLGFTPRS